MYKYVKLFIMLNNNASILTNLKMLGLTPDESKVYTTLLSGSMSHLEVARKSGVNRTKVYRIAEELMKRGLVSEETTDAGRALAAANPANLEITLTTAEERLKAQRNVLRQTLPSLQSLFKQGDQTNPDDFVVNTYEGVDGFKQMLWNELKTKDEMVIFGHGTIQDLIASSRWAEKHRVKTLEAGYTIREILNPNGKPDNFTKNAEFISAYNKRTISPDTLALNHQMSIYNNTVAIYNWRNNQKVGTEIINKPYADMMRQVFEHYWLMAS